MRCVCVPKCEIIKSVKQNYLTCEIIRVRNIISRIKDKIEKNLLEISVLYFLTDVSLFSFVCVSYPLVVWH